MLGLPNGVVTIAPWNREWSSYFEQERKSILDTMKDHHVIVHHIGSTAIKHLDAKPVLDIAIEVENFSAIKEQVQLLEQLGYHCMGDQILPDRFYFIKGDPRTHQIHFYRSGSSFLKEQLIFRDALREDGSLRQDYQKLKYKLATSFAEDKHTYAAMKTDFVNRVVACRNQDEPSV